MKTTTTVLALGITLMTMTGAVGCGSAAPASSEDWAAIDAEAEQAVDGKEDRASQKRKKKDAECVREANDFLMWYLDNVEEWSMDEITSSVIVERQGPFLSVEITGLDGGHDEGIYRVLMNRNYSPCEAWDVTRIKSFTP